MQDDHRTRLMYLIDTAISVNKVLLVEEEKFAKAISSSSLEPEQLQELNDKLVALVTKERLFVTAAQSLLKIISQPQAQS